MLVAISYSFGNIDRFVRVDFLLREHTFKFVVHFLPVKMWITFIMIYNILV